MTTVSLAHVPGIPALARGLATGTPDVSAFLPDRPDLETIATRGRVVLAAFRPRGTPPETDPRLAALARGEASAVFAGQQAGLFGGPLLTLVKALAAEKLAADVAAAGTGARAAFWCASEDHDLVEVTRIVLPGPDGPADLGPDASALAGNRSPVGTLAVDVDVEAPVAKAAASLTGPPDEEAVAALLAAHRGKTFFEAFSETLGWLLGGTVPILDAANPRDKPALVPLACRLVRERAEVKKLLQDRDAALEAGGHPLQVRSDPAALPLFARVGADRLLLLETGSKLSVKGLEGTFSAEEVVEHFESGAWLPSFSALSRPLAASVLFPIAATILGPAEIAYWAQAWPLFSWAGIVPPVTVPRPLVALVPAATARVLSKLGLSVADVLEGEEAMLRKKGAGEAGPLLERLAAIRENAIHALDAEEPALLAFDPALKKGIQTTREKTSFAFDKLVEKAAAAAGRSDERTAVQVRRLAEEILPGGILAERAYSALPYVLKFGREAVVGALRRELVWNDPGLQVIPL
ncbi:MAG TPA: bacillithiol biosynthesis BshC [Thermoanaerobaculia bacterium]|nr:bacillithiol biosynthesis BshC [Thermoanaerobaculia bacterium]